MLCEQRTVKGGTMTSEGMIKHKQHPDGFEMPVRLAVRNGGVKTMLEFQPPMRDADGRLIYALPGGGSFVDA